MHKHRRHPSTTSNKSKFSAGRAYTYTFLACLVVTIAERSIHYQSVSQGHQYRSYHMTCRPFERMCIKPMDQFPKGMILLFQCSLPNRPNILDPSDHSIHICILHGPSPIFISVRQSIVHYKSDTNLRVPVPGSPEIAIAISISWDDVVRGNHQELDSTFLEGKLETSNVTFIARIIMMESSSWGKRAARSFIPTSHRPLMY